MTWDRPTWAMVRCQGLWYSRSSAAVVKWRAQGWQAQLLWNHVPNTTWDHRPRCWPNLLPQLGFISPPRSPRQIKENSFLSKQRLLKRPVTVPPGNRIPICWLALEREEMGLFSFLPWIEDWQCVKGRLSCGYRNGDPVTEFKELDVQWRKKWKSTGS